MGQKICRRRRMFSGDADKFEIGHALLGYQITLDSQAGHTRMPMISRAMPPPVRSLHLQHPISGSITCMSMRNRVGTSTLDWLVAWRLSRPYGAKLPKIIARSGRKWLLHDHGEANHLVGDDHLPWQRGHKRGLDRDARLGLSGHDRLIERELRSDVSFKNTKPRAWIANRHGRHTTIPENRAGQNHVNPEGLD